VLSRIDAVKARAGDTLQRKGIDLKKTEILKVRVDPETLDALIRYSESKGGGNVSRVIRELIDRELARDGARESPRDQGGRGDEPATPSGDELRAACAHILASLLLDRRSNDEQAGRTLSQLAEALLRVLTCDGPASALAARAVGERGIGDVVLRRSTGRPPIGGRLDDWLPREDGLYWVAPKSDLRLSCGAGLGPGFVA
jgi:hypothetical protein